jgi:hypothetical protein
MRNGLLLCALVLIACDPVSGIRRRALLDELPPLDCIESVIRSVSDVEDVEPQERESGGFRIYEFSYRVALERRNRAPGIAPSLTVVVDAAGRVAFEQSLLSTPGPVPQAEIDRIRPIMLQIEETIERQCGVASLGTSIQEDCMGVTCGEASGVRAGTGNVNSKDSSTSPQP